MLLKVANPEMELSSVVLSRVVDYIHQESAHEWPAEQLTHLRGAKALAAALTNESIRGWQFQHGKLTLECMQVWPVVRSALAAVFKTLHGYGALLFGAHTSCADFLFHPLTDMFPAANNDSDRDAQQQRFPGRRT